MLKITNDEHFAKVAAFAESKGETTWRHFWRNVFRAYRYADYDQDVCEHEALSFVQPGQRTVPEEWSRYVLGNKIFTLYSDSAPASFGFSAQTVFGGIGGAIVYHGDQSGWVLPNGETIPEGYGVNTYSVRIDSSPDPWSWHT